MFCYKNVRMQDMLRVDELKVSDHSDIKYHMTLNAIFSVLWTHPKYKDSQNWVNQQNNKFLEAIFERVLIFCQTIS